ncbi:MAG TPA: right-handed parallel beta-helix repeat-containing protein [bacterium]|nr:right-handed parallel beta-helix repeat-containing protein [bacterium]HPN35679.1 right-handed parallel beta-helix repeat-containing protein [bacterium]
MAKKTLLWLPACSIVCFFSCTGLRQTHPATASHSFISVTDFLPKGFSKDGSVSYQLHLQRALDAAAGKRLTLFFPPMIYALDEKGLQLHSHLTLLMHGAVFQLRKECTEDGQAFHGRDLQQVAFIGGEVCGPVERWPEGVNIRGIHLTGRCEKIRIQEMYFHHLTSNAVGVFAAADAWAKDIWITDVVAEEGCNEYGDYLSGRPGPETNSSRQDQGLIALYYVQDFTVRGCRLERSRSDGTHFYRCREGAFVHNRVYAARMGGYFLETCENVCASDNLILNNGSRGVTIERGSKDCLLQGNIIAHSGREGLWAPNCTGLIVTGNHFTYNGRKANGAKKEQLWNANITINSAHDPTNTLTRDYLISNNIVYTSNSQIAAVRIETAAAKNIVIRQNQFLGEKDLVVIEGEELENVTMEK